MLKPILERLRRDSQSLVDAVGLRQYGCMGTSQYTHNWARGCLKPQLQLPPRPEDGAQHWECLRWQALLPRHASEKSCAFLGDVHAMGEGEPMWRFRPERLSLALRPGDKER